MKHIMGTVQRIAKNMGVLLGAGIVGSALSFLYMMYIARYLGPDNYGILTFALALNAILGVFTDFGLQPLIVREVARDRSLAAKYLSNIIGMKLILIVLTFGLLALTINVLDYPYKTVKVVCLIVFSTAFSAFTAVFYSIFQAFEKMEYQACGQVLNSALMLGGVIVAIRYDFTVTGFAALYSLVTLLIVLFSYTVLKLKLGNQFLDWSIHKIEVDAAFWKKTIKQAFPFGLAIGFVMGFYWVDSVMLSVMKGDKVVGWYNAAYRLVLALLIVPNSLISAIYPIMSMYHKTSKDSLRVSFEKSFKYLTILAMPIGAGTTLLAKKFILLIFGSAYVESTLPLQILIWSTVFIFMSQPLGNALNSIDRQAIITKVTGICVIVNVFLNLMLIPKYSLIGSSVATVLTQVIGSFLIFISGSKVGFSIFTRDVAKIMVVTSISSILMAGFILYFRDAELMVIVPLGALLYLAILSLLGTLGREDFLLAKVILKGH